MQICKKYQSLTIVSKAIIVDACVRKQKRKRMDKQNDDDVSSIEFELLEEFWECYHIHTLTISQVRKGEAMRNLG